MATKTILIWAGAGLAVLVGGYFAFRSTPAFASPLEVGPPSGAPPAAAPPGTYAGGQSGTGAFESGVAAAARTIGKPPAASAPGVPKGATYGPKVAAQRGRGHF